MLYLPTGKNKQSEGDALERARDGNDNDRTGVGKKARGQRGSEMVKG